MEILVERLSYVLETIIKEPMFFVPVSIRSIIYMIDDRYFLHLNLNPIGEDSGCLFTLKNYIFSDAFVVIKIEFIYNSQVQVECILSYYGSI